MVNTEKIVFLSCLSIEPNSDHLFENRLPKIYKGKDLIKVNFRENIDIITPL